MKKIYLLCVIAACVLTGCRTNDFPPAGDDRGVVEPGEISNSKAHADDPKLPDMTPWWRY